MAKKKNKKFLGFIETKPLIIFHYLPLTGVVFLAHWLSDITSIESWAVANGWLGWTLLAVWYFAFLLIGDNLIHTIIKED